MHSNVVRDFLQENRLAERMPEGKAEWLVQNASMMSEAQIATIIMYATGMELRAAYAVQLKLEIADNRESVARLKRYLAAEEPEVLHVWEQELGNTEPERCYDTMCAAYQLLDNIRRDAGYDEFDFDELDDDRWKA